jgi:hypothetical protein
MSETEEHREQRQGTQKRQARARHRGDTAQGDQCHLDEEIAVEPQWIQRRTERRLGRCAPAHLDTPIASGPTVTAIPDAQALAGEHRVARSAVVAEQPEPASVFHPFALPSSAPERGKATKPVAP